MVHSCWTKNPGVLSEPSLSALSLAISDAVIFCRSCAGHCSPIIKQKKAGLRRFFESRRVYKAVQPISIASRPAVESSSECVSLSELIDEYCRERAKGENWTGRTSVENEAIFAAYWQELRLEYPHNVPAYLDRAVAESDKCPYTQYLPIFMTDT